MSICKYRRLANSLVAYLIFLFSFCLVGCLGSVDQLAQNNLYPTSVANKTQVPVSATKGYSQEMLQVDNMQISLWHYTQPVRFDAPVIIYLHGNGVNIGGLERSFLEKVKILNTHFVVFDYPSYGKSTGTPSQQTLVRTAEAVLDWTVKEYPNSEIIIWGQSLGTGVALQLVARNQDLISRIVASQGWDTLENIMKHHFELLQGQVSEKWKRANQYNSVTAARTIHIPVLIHHGTNDKTIPFSFGQNLANSFSSTQMYWRPVRGRDHNDLLLDSQVWNEIRSFVLGE